MNENKQLYIPVKIKKTKEVLNIDGISKPQAIQISIIFIVGLIIGIIIFIVTKNFFYPILSMSMFGSGGYLFLKKDSTNRNTIDKLRKQIEFSKSQKRFYYKYKNIYERERNE